MSARLPTAPAYFEVYGTDLRARVTFPDGTTGYAIAFVDYDMGQPCGVHALDVYRDAVNEFNVNPLVKREDAADLYSLLEASADGAHELFTDELATAHAEFMADGCAERYLDQCDMFGEKP
jgi:hypothetical protein